MQVIKVCKITRESYHRLIESGFTVQFINSEPKSPYAQYKYLRLIKSNKIVLKLKQSHTATGCKVCHKAQCELELN